MSSPQCSRRQFLRAGLGSALGLLPGTRVLGETPALREFRLRPQTATVAMVGDGYPATEVWAYNGDLPGPELRLRQGERLRIAVNNGLQQPTTVHWHGIRLPNAMDGVPHLTQAPIEPGESFTYDFTPPDAGTYWYHPHFRSFEQIGRGLYGALIVEEPEPPVVDRDLVWLLDDWRLTPAAAIAEDFGNRHDLSHAGRIGNTATINGRVPESLSVQAGERLRLRLINTANARVFALQFERHQPRIIAVDGQPVTPHTPAGNKIVLGPATRVDIILDLVGSPGDSFRVIDSYYRERAYLLTELAYSDRPPLREQPADGPVGLTPNALPEPDLGNAERHRIVFAGGAMGGMDGAIMDGSWTDIRTLARNGVLWAINGVAATGMVMEPLATLQLGRSYILAMHNDSAFPHPIHLHGHHFRVLSRNGQPTRYRQWQDTVLLDSNEQVEVALVADNPGDWMFHCHILEHQAAGMMGVVRVV